MAADDAERRKHERIRCRVQCEVQEGRKPSEGLIRDVSLGGLSLQTSVSLDQGDVAQLLIPRTGVRPEVYLEAIVWRSRRVRSRKGGETSNVLGLVLSDAPESYVDLLDSLRPSKSADRKQEAAKPKAANEASRVVEKPTAGEEDEEEAESESGSSIKIEFGAPPPETEPPHEKPEQLALSKPKRFQVRVKMRAQPRTRSIMVFADTAANARDLALSEVGEGWMVLEAESRD
jgi:hypothetical protein